MSGFRILKQGSQITRAACLGVGIVGRYTLQIKLLRGGENLNSGQNVTLSRAVLSATTKSNIRLAAIKNV